MLVQPVNNSEEENSSLLLESIDEETAIHMPLTKETKDLINYPILKKMKKNSVIVNTARGGIINERDLNKALNENLIFGAGLDVFEKEPINSDNPLLKNK